MYSIIDIHDILTYKKYEFKHWKDVSCPSHCHYILEAVIVLSGEFIIEKGNKTYILTKNEMMFIMPFELHKFDTQLHSEIVVIQISPQIISDFDKILKNKTPKNPVCKLTNNDIEQLYSHIEKVENNEVIELNCIFFNLLSYVSQNNIFIDYTVPNDTYQKMLIYIHSHFEENITLKDIAKALNVNYVYLSRVFSKNTNIRFNDLINSFRLTKSINLLKDSELTISEISYLCGFGSIRNFNRIFLKEMKCTPKEYRKYNIKKHLQQP